MSKQTYVQLSGKIKKVCPVKTFQSGFKKQEIWLVVEGGKYENCVPVTFKKDKIADLNGYKEGDFVTVGAFISGNVWTPKPESGKEPACFLSLDGWKISEYKDGDENGGDSDDVLAEDSANASGLDDTAIDDMPF